MTSSLDSVLNSLRSSYAESLPEKIEHLKELSKQGQADELRKAAHKLKGSGQSYGFPEISKICEQLETSAELTDWHAIAHAINELDAIIETLE